MGHTEEEQDLVKRMDLKKLVQTLAPSLTSCVALDKSCKAYSPLFPHL